MDEIADIVRNIGVDPFVAGLIAIFFFGELAWRCAGALLRKREARAGKATMAYRQRRTGLDRNSGQDRLRPEADRASRNLLHFVGARLAGLAILAGGMAMYDAMTAADHLRAEMGDTPPMAVLYATAFSATLEFIFGLTLLLIAISSALRLKKWASASPRPKHSRATCKASHR